MNPHRRRLLLATGAVALLAARTAPARASAVHVVTIDAFEFKPPKLAVKRGDTVEWRNADPVPHTVTAKGAFDSGSIAAASAWKHVAAAKGRFEYVCTFHPTMRGELVVE